MRVWQGRTRDHIGNKFRKQAAIAERSVCVCVYLCVAPLLAHPAPLIGKVRSRRPSCLMSPSLSLKIANKNAAADSAEVRPAAAFDPRLGMSRGGCRTCANVSGEREHMCVCESDARCSQSPPNKCGLIPLSPSFPNG